MHDRHLFLSSSCWLSFGFWGFEENPESFYSFAPIWIEKIVPFLEALCYLGTRDSDFKGFYDFQRWD
ncbi:hypothetical protein Peur_035250 [Populus x canadensis]